MDDRNQCYGVSCCMDRRHGLREKGYKKTGGFSNVNMEKNGKKSVGLNVIMSTMIKKCWQEAGRKDPRWRKERDKEN